MNIEARRFSLSIISEEVTRFVALSPDGNWRIASYERIRFTGRVSGPEDETLEASRRILRDLGFTVSECEFEPRLKWFILPMSWDLGVELHNRLGDEFAVEIKDDKGHLRGFLTPCAHGPTLAQLAVRRRFYVNHYVDAGYGFEIRDELTGKVIHEFSFKRNRRTRLYCRIRNRLDWFVREKEQAIWNNRELQRMSSQWLTEHYPGWEDPSKWWDEGQP